MISSICGLWAESRPRVTAGTWSPMAWMKTYLVRRRRPSPKPRRSKPKSTSWKGGDDHGSWSRSLLKIVFRKKHIQWGIRLKCTYLIFGCETRDTDYFLALSFNSRGFRTFLDQLKFTCSEMHNTRYICCIDNTSMNVFYSFLGYIHLPSHINPQKLRRLTLFRRQLSYLIKVWDISPWLHWYQASSGCSS